VIPLVRKSSTTSAVVPPPSASNCPTTVNTMTATLVSEQSTLAVGQASLPTLLRPKLRPPRRPPLLLSLPQMFPHLLQRFLL
jgi:hypothetical protein